MFSNWWAVFKRQWSWKNDKSMVFISVTVGIILSAITLSTGELKVDPMFYLPFIVVGFGITIAIMILSIYHFLKILILGTFLYATVYLVKNGNKEQKAKAMDHYREAWDWRQ